MLAPSSAYGDAVLVCFAGLSTPAHVESIHCKNGIPAAQLLLLVIRSECVKSHVQKQYV